MPTFKDWTPMIVEAHNRRVAAGAQAVKAENAEAVKADIVVNLSIKPSTNEANLNKLEKAWLAKLRLLNFPWIGIQNITLKLADDTRYTPDFTVIDENGRLVAYETKGFMRDDAHVKIKVAATSFRWIHFVLVTKEKGQWNEKEIKP